VTQAHAAYQDHALLEASLSCLSEWQSCWQQICRDELPGICRIRSWGSDFDHGQAWTISPVVLTSRTVSRIGSLNLDLVSKLSGLLATVYPTTYQALAPWIESDRIVYAAFSLLKPGAVLRAHSHRNPESAKLHVLIESAQRCGLMHYRRDDSGRLVKEINHWRDPGQFCFFDDNQVHSAWNQSDVDRVVMVIDYVIATQ
jgi:hypothetical protein